MMLSRLVTAVCTGAGIGAALIGASPLAHANQDPGANPPNCSAADLEGVRAAVRYEVIHVLVKMRKSHARMFVPTVNV